jgi:hypothetical protein
MQDLPAGGVVGDEDGVAEDRAVEEVTAGDAAAVETRLGPRSELSLASFVGFAFAVGRSVDDPVLLARVVCWLTDV